VNLIPLNPTGGFASTIHQRRGIDVAAGCGQLRAEKARSAQRVEAK